jgi:hypothetical protein
MSDALIISSKPEGFHEQHLDFEQVKIGVAPFQFGVKCNNEYQD